jgi:hypothetical protein
LKQFQGSLILRRIYFSHMIWPWQWPQLCQRVLQKWNQTCSAYSSNGSESWKGQLSFLRGATKQSYILRGSIFPLTHIWTSNVTGEKEGRGQRGGRVEVMTVVIDVGLSEQPCGQKWR